ncbi:MAG: iron chaperone [Longimicrobiaceae bacterium]
MGEKPTSVAEYLATLTDEQRAGLDTLRGAVRAVAPEVEEGISYAIPVFRLRGKPLVWVAAWKQHFSLYPLSAAMLRDHAAELDGYETAKGTVRFPASRPLPVGLVKKLVAARVAVLQES